MQPLPHTFNLDRPKLSHSAGRRSCIEAASLPCKTPLHNHSQQLWLAAVSCPAMMCHQSCTSNFHLSESCLSQVSIRGSIAASLNIQLSRHGGNS